MLTVFVVTQHTYGVGLIHLATLSFQASDRIAAFLGHTLALTIQNFTFHNNGLILLHYELK